LGISLFLDMAGVADMGNAVWDEGLPIMGGYRLIVGLVRLWGAAFPVVAILIPIVLVWAFRYRDNKQASMKVGR
jgi:hypothetical protein